MIIDGKAIAAKLKDSVRQRVASLGFTPVFCDVLVGDDPVSAQYVAMKGKAAEAVGMEFRRADIAASATTEQIIDVIEKLNSLPRLCGLIVQLPLPAGIDRDRVLNAIDPRIDVDCIGTKNAERFYSGRPYVPFPTAAAIMAVLDSLQTPLSHLHFVVVGRGMLVGKPVEQLLRQRRLSVATVSRGTESIVEKIRAADVVISATGHGKLITGDMIKPGAIVIDAGTSELDGGIVGDVDTESVEPIARYLSPVPGGVGPVTVAALLDNVCLVAQQSQSNN